MQKPRFASKVEVLPAPQSKRPRTTVLHGAVAVVGVGADVGADLISILCAQTVRFCYYMRSLIANVFFAFAAKLHIDRPCVVALVTGPALVDGPRQNAHSVCTDCLFS